MGKHYIVSGVCVSTGMLVGKQCIVGCSGVEAQGMHGSLMPVDYFRVVLEVMAASWEGG